MKYVLGVSGYVIFPDSIIHADMAKACKSEIGSPVSAGFVRVSGGKLQTYGRSNSLRLNSKRTDAEKLV